MIDEGSSRLVQNVVMNSTAILQCLKKVRDKTLENPSLRVDRALEKSKTPIILGGEDSGVLVRIDPRLRGKTDGCEMKWDAKNERVVASLSPDLFAPQEMVFLGKTFEVFYVAGKDAALGISIDVDGKKIYVNPFNTKLTQYSVRILDVYIVLKVAEAISNTKGELVENALALLGVKSEVTQKYIMPLGDDLRRTLARVRA